MFTFQSLRIAFGEETAQLAKRYVNIARSISIFKTHLDFTVECRDFHVVPQSLRIKRLVYTPQGHKILEQAERRFIKARVHECLATLKEKKLDLFFTRQQLEYSIPEVFPSLQSFAERVASTTAEKQQVSQGKKVFETAEQTNNRTQHQYR